MTGRRLVLVDTLDHDLISLRCPDWCTGDMHRDGGYRVDMVHSSANTEFSVPVAGRSIVLLRLALEERPFVDGPSGQDPFITMEIGGDWCPVDVTAVDEFAAALAAMAAELQAAARRFAAILAEGGETR